MGLESANLTAAAPICLPGFSAFLPFGSIHRREDIPETHPRFSTGHLLVFVEDVQTLLILGQLFSIFCSNAAWATFQRQEILWKLPSTERQEVSA